VQIAKHVGNVVHILQTKK